MNCLLLYADEHWRGQRCRGIEYHALGEVKKCAACSAAMDSGAQWGTHYTEQELLEYSLVTIPANPDAVMQLQAAGLVRRREAEEWLEAASVRPSRGNDFVAEVEDLSRFIRQKTAQLRAR